MQRPFHKRMLIQNYMKNVTQRQLFAVDSDFGTNFQKYEKSSEEFCAFEDNTYVVCC